MQVSAAERSGEAISGKYTLSLHLSLIIFTVQINTAPSFSPSALEGPNIQSGFGTIRGKKNGVRAKLEIISGRTKMVQDDALAKLYDEEKNGKIVLLVDPV